MVTITVTETPQFVVAGGTPAASTPIASACPGVGTIAVVVEHGRLPRGAHAAALTGEARGIPGVARTGPDGNLYVLTDSPTAGRVLLVSPVR